MRSAARYDSRAGAGPQTCTSSASRVWKASRSASEAIAAVGMPSSRPARSTRAAISPRFATSSLRNKKLGLGQVPDRLLEALSVRHEIDLAARDTALHRGLRHGERDVDQHPRVEGLRDDVARPEVE